MGICASNIGEAVLHHECWAEAACIDRSKRSLDDLTGRITVLSCVAIVNFGDFDCPSMHDLCQVARLNFLGTSHEMSVFLVSPVNYCMQKAASDLDSIL